MVGLQRQYWGENRVLTGTGSQDVQIEMIFEPYSGKQILHHITADYKMEGNETGEILLFTPQVATLSFSKMLYEI